MAAKDFAPGAPGNINPAKTYLIKGSTLKKLLKETIFDRNDFNVREDEAKRLVNTRKIPARKGKNLNLEVYLTNFYNYGDGQWTITRAETPDQIILFRDGMYTETKAGYEEFESPADTTTIQIDHNSLP